MGGKETTPARFDFVFLTVGAWPNFNDPWTDQGIEKTVALDLLSRHVVLEDLMEFGLVQSGACIMSTLASTQQVPIPFPPEAIQQRLAESINRTKVPGMVPFSLFPVAIAVDAWLIHLSKLHPNMHFVGMFPGIIATDIFASSFPSWLAPIFKLFLTPLAITEEESGWAHVAIATSQNVRRNHVSFLNHLLEGRYVHPSATKQDLAAWVWNFAEMLRTQYLYNNSKIK